MREVGENAKYTIESLTGRIRDRFPGGGSRRSLPFLDATLW
jgi:hypothetical protein